MAERRGLVAVAGGLGAWMRARKLMTEGQPIPTNHRAVAAVVCMAFLVAACNGSAILVERRTAEGELISSSDLADRADVIAPGGNRGVDLGPGGRGGAASGSGRPGTAAAGTNNCATNSDPERGFTEDSLKLGTIIPVTGTLRPFGEQTARVLKLSVELLNNISHFPGPYKSLNWGCPTRPGIFGRRVEMKIFGLQAGSPEEAFSGMRRLIDVENVFLVRDCYLTEEINGPAVRYAEKKGVPQLFCYSTDMPLPELAPWNYSPGTDPQVAAAIHAGYLISKLGRERLAILADPQQEDTLVRAVRRVADHLGVPIPDGCIVFKPSQDTSNGMRSEIAQIRTCYGGQGTDPRPDAVVALMGTHAVFGALEAKGQGWRGADSDVIWSCPLGCWTEILADICGDACEGMLTDCGALPCVPFADPDRYPAVRYYRSTHARYFPREPEDILTYAPIATTGGIALWLAMTGPELSRAAFRDTLAGLHNWSAGIGPIIDITPNDHFGAKSVWVIKLTDGKQPYFEDETGRFLTLGELGIPYSIITED